MPTSITDCLKPCPPGRNPFSFPSGLIPMKKTAQQFFSENTLRQGGAVFPARISAWTPSTAACHSDRMSTLPLQNPRIYGQSGIRWQITDSRGPLLFHDVSGKRLLPDVCTRWSGLVRKEWLAASAAGPFRLLSDTSAGAAFRRKTEKKAVKSTAETRLADRLFRCCGQESGFVRTKPSVLAHKKSVSSATPSASFRKENRAFA